MKRKRMLQCLLALLTGWALTLTAAAEEERWAEPRFERIVPDANATVVSCLLQDEKGMVWMGSDKGLYGFDGYRTQPHYERGGKSNSRIYCGLAEGERLYLGADVGLLIYNCRTDRYEETDTDFPADVRALAWFDGRLWIGTLNGLFTYHTDSRALTRVDEGLTHHTVYSLSVLGDVLYIGTYNGCSRYKRTTGMMEPLQLSAGKGRSNCFVNALLSDSVRQCVWIGMEGSLLKYTPADGSMVSIGGQEENSVKSLRTDVDGRLLIGTDNGLYVYHEGEPLWHVVHNSRNQHSLSDNIVWTLFTDRDGNVWVGTDYGVSMRQRRTTLQEVPLARLTGDGDGNRFYALYRDSKGRYWFGGTNGIIRFEAEGSNVCRYTMGDGKWSISHNRVRQVYEDREGCIWVATDGGVNRYDEATRRFVAYSIVDSTRRYNANWVYSLFEDERQQLWIATCLGGIFVVDKQKLTASKHSPYVAERTFNTAGGLSGMFVNQMTADLDGNIWALLYNTSHCIEKIDPHTGKVTHIDAPMLRDEQTPNVMLRAEDGNIWLGYPGGLARVTSADNGVTLLPFRSSDRNEVLAMAEAEGRIWASTSDGIWVADRQTMELQWLNVSDKRFTAMCYDRRSGKLYLGAADEFAVSSPQKLLSQQEERPLMLTALYVNNRLYQPKEGQVDGSIRYARQIYLDSDQNNLTLDFSDLSYAGQEKPRLVYRFERDDAEWTELPPGTNRVHFNNLANGDYRLLVSKVNAYGKPDDAATYSLDIRILPPWYLTGWAKTVYALFVLILAAWTVNFFRVKSHLKRTKEEKEKILEQSRAKMEFFTNLSHDLKAPLSLIISPISRMLPETKNRQTRKELEQVQRNALKLNALIHRGLDVDRMENGSNALLIWSRVELVSFARAVFDLYADDGHNRSRGLTFRFHATQEKLYAKMDVIKLESILDNLLSNAVKYTPDGGSISLSLETGPGDKEIILSVTDTGIGIRPDDQPYVFQRFYQSPRTAGRKEGTGIGLYLVKTYTELHGGTVKLISAEGRGTTMQLSLPVADDGLPADAPQTAVQTASPPADAPTVLVVDDDAEMRTFICRVLGADYRCLTADNGKTALAEAMKAQPALIISDVVMPDMDGFELVRRLKKHIPTSTIPIILLTGRDDKETELESIRLHTDAFVSKPFEPELLLRRVEQLIDRRKTQEAQVRMETLATPAEMEATSSDEKFLVNVTSLIEEHITDPDLNVNALCEWTSTANKQMYRKIKQLTGMTPVEYIKSIRMKKAAMLLKQQRFTVAEVMYMVGFSNHSYFSKCFQAAFGVTPKEYGK